MENQQTFAVPKYFIETATELGYDPAKLIRTLARDWVRVMKLNDEYITFPEALEIAAQYKRGVKKLTSVYSFVQKWQKDHPEGDPLRMRRLTHVIHRGDFIERWRRCLCRGSESSKKILHWVIPVCQSGTRKTLKSSPATR